MIDTPRKSEEGPLAPAVSPPITASRVTRFVITGLGTGYLPIAPGTWGSAGACVSAGLLAWILGPSGWALHLAMAGLGLLACVGCVLTGATAQALYAKKDPGQCTIDEWAGQYLTLLALPFGTSALSVVLALAVGFVCFRFFDILKPPPVRNVEKIPLGWGVLLDDLVAGVFASMAAQAILRLALS